MFFGAGNVIFPPYLGMESGPQWLAGFSAYFIADIGLALAAMFALLRVGSSEAVLQRVGRVPSEVPMCAIILCVGPMVAIPRTSASTFEMAIALNLPGVSAVVFSVLFFALILALCIRESAVVDIVGKVLTPLLLVGLAAIIIKGRCHAARHHRAGGEDRQRRRHRRQGRLPNHGRARRTAVRHSRAAERDRQGATPSRAGSSAS